MRKHVLVWLESLSRLTVSRYPASVVDKIIDPLSYLCSAAVPYVVNPRPPSLG